MYMQYIGTFRSKNPIDIRAETFIKEFTKFLVLASSKTNYE